MANSYKTILSPSESLFKDKGSKHFGFSFPVVNEEEIKEIIKKIKSNHPNANHHCFAYKLGVKREKIRASDDGEPANTAGKPILGQIEAFDLTNILIVVVRYFGGTKLGKGGLINAYRTASTLALENSKIIEKEIRDYFELLFNYEQMSAVMKIMAQESFNIENKNFHSSCELLVSCIHGAGEKKMEKLNSLPNIKYKLIKTE